MCFIKIIEIVSVGSKFKALIADVEYISHLESEILCVLLKTICNFGKLNFLSNSTKRFTFFNNPVGKIAKKQSERVRF